MRSFSSFPKVFLIPVLLFVVGTPHSSSAQSCALNLLSGSVTLSNGTFSYCSMNISAGATLVIGGSVTLNLTGDVNIDGTIKGSGLGYGSVFAPLPGPGAGGDGVSISAIGSVTYYSGGSGGGHGGMGGGPLGGQGNDSTVNPTMMGSNGGNGGPVSAVGGNGGAAFILNAPNGNVTINGTIEMNGAMGGGLLGNATGSGGGGAGGTISVDALVIRGSGTLNALGGWGGSGSGYGHGGGGGRIRLCDTVGTAGYTGALSVQGGMGGVGPVYCPQCVGCPCIQTGGTFGVAGTTYICPPLVTPTPTSTPPLTPTPTVTPTTTPTPVPPDCTQLSVSKNLFEPFRGSLDISIGTCQYPGVLELWIFNSAGEHIVTLDHEDLQGPVLRSYQWDGKNKNGGPCSSGVYVIMMHGPFSTKTARFLLVR